MVAKAQPKTRWGKAGTPNKIQSPRPAKNRAETTLVRHLTDNPPSAKSVRRVGAGVKAMFGACGLWRFRGMFDMGQPPRKQGNGITIDYLAGAPARKGFLMEKDFEPSVADHSDMYIGCFERYGWDQIKYLVNSLDRSGFTGRKVMIVLGADKATLEKLASKGWKAVPFGKRDAREQVDLPVHVLRFFYISYLLERLPENQKPDYVITTDVRDVIFQKDPFAALRNYVRSHPSLVLIASSESMRYRDEPWGNQNLLETFGSFVYEKYKNCEIYNVGVLAGTLQAIQELSQTIFELSISREKKIVDQAVFNFIVHQKTFSSNILKLPSEAGWAAQLGTTADPEKKTSFAPFLMEPAPIMKQAGQDHKVFTSDGSTEFFIVHQYDRIPEWKQLLEAQYDDKCGMGPDHIIEVRAGATSPCNNILGPCEGTLLLPNVSNRARSGENAFCRVATSALLKARAIFPARVLAAIRRASNALRCF